MGFKWPGILVNAHKVEMQWGGGGEMFIFKKLMKNYFRVLSVYLLLSFIYLFYSEPLNMEYIERIHQMSYSSLSDNGMLQIFSFLIK